MKRPVQCEDRQTRHSEESGAEISHAGFCEGDAGRVGRAAGIAQPTSLMPAGLCVLTIIWSLCLLACGPHAKPLAKEVAWTPPKFAKVVGYRFEIPPEQDGDGHFSLIRHGKIEADQLSWIQRGSAELTGDQTARLTGALVSKDRYGPVACYLPHHIFVFYAGDGLPVAAIEVCFMCRAVQTFPDRPQALGCYQDLVCLAKLTNELGLWQDKETAAQWIAAHQAHLRGE